ncbi:hypothetical protein AAFF_G00203570 [Aldrovandia affinis]|uniref:Uncharacterized protein n=1 Tax=Aldrovandia affinis TaxID=143900 RepID=A0AAD7SZ59_9TELE|nr:hypothetical protein AAFF_G00203570 [Aldrovandia affinis]
MRGPAATGTSVPFVRSGGHVDAAHVGPSAASRAPARAWQGSVAMQRRQAQQAGHHPPSAPRTRAFCGNQGDGWLCDIWNSRRIPEWMALLREERISGKLDGNYSPAVSCVFDLSVPPFVLIKERHPAGASRAQLFREARRYLRAPSHRGVTLINRTALPLSSVVMIGREEGGSCFNDERIMAPALRTAG